MKKPLSTWLLRGAAMVCFIDAATLPKDWSHAVLAGVLGLLLLPMAASSIPQPARVVISAWAFVLVIVGRDQHVINGEGLFWALVMAAAFIVFMSGWRKETE